MWVKICGIRDPADVEAIVASGPDAIGLNFFGGSPRAVSVPAARAIVERLPASIEPVGLFVNHAVPEIRRIASDCGLRTLQLHGDERPELLAELSDFRLIRAFRIHDASELAEVGEYLAACRSLGVILHACLIDARVEGHYGGTGRTVPWDDLGRAYPADQWPPLILAGGLCAANVAEAIRAAHPWGVDVAGGVEESPGRKSPHAMREFTRQAREA